MASSSLVAKNQEEVRHIQLVKSETFPPPNYHAIPKIYMKGDSMDVLSLISPKFIMIHDVWSFYIYKIGEVGDYEIHVTYQKLCNGVLKDKFKIIERKWLTSTLDFLRNFKFGWIKVVLSQICDMEL